MQMEIKQGVNIEDLKEVQIALWLLITHAAMYCGSNGLPPMQITSLKGDRDNLKVSSQTHADGRAADISVQEWSQTHIIQFVFHMNKTFASIGAISTTTGESVVALYHDAGYGAHIHLQVRPNAQYSRYLFAVK